MGASGLSKSCKKMTYLFGAEAAPSIEYKVHKASNLPYTALMWDSHELKSALKEALDGCIIKRKFIIFI
jgi:hypothetical protein